MFNAGERIDVARRLSSIGGFSISIVFMPDDCQDYKGMGLRTRGSISLGLIAAACILWNGCRSAPKLTARQAEGKHVYDVGCAHCHEENDLHLKTVPPNLHRLFDRKTLPVGGVCTLFSHSHR